MSKIGRLNLELMEQAEELGFSTTQEALDNGYHVVEDMVTGEATLKKLDEQEQAHEAWLKEKEKVLYGIKKLRSKIPEDWDETIEALDSAIKFIEGVKYEQ